MIIWGKIKIASFPLHTKALSAGYLIRPHKYISAENYVNRWKSQEKGGLMSGQSPHSVFRARLGTCPSGLISWSSSCASPGQGSMRCQITEPTTCWGLVMKGPRLLGFKSSRVDCNKQLPRPRDCGTLKAGAVCSSSQTAPTSVPGTAVEIHSMGNPVEYIQPLTRTQTISILCLVCCHGFSFHSEFKWKPAAWDTMVLVSIPPSLPMYPPSTPFLWPLAVL